MRIEKTIKTKEEEAGQPSGSNNIEGEIDTKVSDMKAAVAEMTAKARAQAEANEEVKSEVETATGNKEKTDWLNSY